MVTAVFALGAGNALTQTADRWGRYFGDGSPFAARPTEADANYLGLGQLPFGPGVDMVDLRCRVVATGALGDCRIDRESNPGVGLGPAAIRVAALTRLKPVTADGTPVEGLFVALYVVFGLGEGETPVAYPHLIWIGPRLPPPAVHPLAPEPPLPATPPA